MWWIDTLVYFIILPLSQFPPSISCLVYLFSSMEYDSAAIYCRLPAGSIAVLFLRMDHGDFFPNEIGKYRKIILKCENIEN